MAIFRCSISKSCFTFSFFLSPPLALRLSLFKLTADTGTPPRGSPFFWVWGLETPPFPPEAFHSVTGGLHSLRYFAVPFFSTFPLNSTESLFSLKVWRSRFFLPSPLKPPFFLFGFPFLGGGGFRYPSRRQATSPVPFFQRPPPIGGLFKSRKPLHPFRNLEPVLKVLCRPGIFWELKPSPLIMKPLFLLSPKDT